MHGAAKPRRTLSQELEQLAYDVIGAAIEVHRRLGPGFLESVYEAALAIELATRRIPFRRQVTMHVVYREVPVAEHIFDFLVGDQLVVELKAVERIAPVHFAQVHSYLKAGAYELGLLINFEVAALKEGIRRVILRGDEDVPP